jgi:hypothetical protein
MTRSLIAAALASVIVGPAFAQSTTTTTQEYYVVQDTSTKKCTIVDKKPTTTGGSGRADGLPITFRSRKWHEDYQGLRDALKVRSIEAKGSK